MNTTLDASLWAALLRGVLIVESFGYAGYVASETYNFTIVHPLGLVKPVPAAA